MTPDVSGAISGPGTLTLASPLQFNHTPGIGDPTLPDTPVLLTTLPGALMQAGFFLATYYGLIRGATAAVIQSARGSSTSSDGGQKWYDRAEKIISRYARVGV
jgi:hypothetical protein